MKKVSWKIKIWAAKSVRISLRWIFKFDKWHLYTLIERKYAQEIIQFSNRKSIRNKFAEIGCGLGDIIKKVNYTEVYGFDSDENILRAARLLKVILFKRNIYFQQFKFPESQLKSSYDVIVMVNWIHHIEANVLKSKINQFFEYNLNNEGFIILDTVKHKDYKFNHDIDFLSSNLNCNIIKLGEYERQRQVWAICK